MARHSKGASGVQKDDQEELTVVVLKFKGSSETLQKDLSR